MLRDVLIERIQEKALMLVDNEFVVNGCEPEKSTTDEDEIQRVHVKSMEEAIAEELIETAEYNLVNKSKLKKRSG